VRKKSPDGVRRAWASSASSAGLSDTGRPPRWASATGERPARG
jgi:hypothetical protein